MPLTLPYASVDVFTTTALAGNQLGIILLTSLSPEDQTSLTQALKLRIAREINYSETIFIHPFSPTTSSRRIEIFTPESELPFAGHPTIGAVGYISTHLSPEKDNENGECLLEMKAGIVRAKFDRETGAASAEIPHDVRVHGVKLGFDRVMASQPNIVAGDENLSDAMAGSSHAFVSIVKGVNFALVDLSLQPDLLKRVEVSNSYVATKEDLDQGWVNTIIGSLFFVRKPDQGDGVVRVEQRVIVIGLEDPATGAGSAALCAWLALEGGGKGKTYHFELEQGTQMGRKSLIGCKVTLSEDGTKVQEVTLLGQSKLVMKGEMYL